MPFFSRPVILAVSSVIVVTGCGAAADPAASAARFVTTAGVAAPPDVLAGEKVQARTVRQAVERAVLAEAARLAAERKAAEEAQLAAAAAQAAEAAAVEAAAAEAAAAERAAAERAAAERAAAERTASRAARAKAPAPAAVSTAPTPPRVVAPRVAAPAPVPGGTGQSAYEAEIFSLTNSERARAGLAPLQRSSCAADRAATWSRHLAAIGALAHQSLGPVMSACGAQGAAENVAFGTISAAQMVANWMNSPGHRANILNPSLTHLGVGAVQTGDGRWYGTQVFLTL